MPEPIYLTTGEVAAVLRCSDDAVRRLILSGRLPCERRRQMRGRVAYYPTTDEVRAYLSVYDQALMPECDRRWPAA